jgi:hypothetical protein
MKRVTATEPPTSGIAVAVTALVALAIPPSR